MAPAPIVLILGAGPNIGKATARRFQSLGYDVAVVTRSGPASPARTPEGYLAIGADLSDTAVYPKIFGAVRETFAGQVPDVVIFNAAAATFPSDPTNLFSVPAAGLQRDIDLTVRGAFAAAGAAYGAWQGEGSGAKKARGQFFFTGNLLARWVPDNPNWVTLGLTKSATSFWVGLADNLYKEKGYRFIVADQRLPGGGGAVQGADGEAHAEIFTRVAQDPEPWPWYLTFVDGTKFEPFDDGQGRYQ